MNIKFANDETIFNINNVENDGVPTLSFAMLDELGVPNLYSTRYRSYDTNTKTGEKGLRCCRMRDEVWADVEPVVKGDLDALSQQLGTSLSKQAVTNQKHTANIFKIEAEDTGWTTALPENRKNIDGLITNVENAELLAYGGDCPPVYIVDPVQKAIGLVHAGWRGTFARIPQVAIEAMIQAYGCRPEDMYAAVGPGICHECYEMGDEVYDQLVDDWSREDADLLMRRVVNPDGSEGKYHLDLWKANRMTLERSGIPADHIAVTNVCTCCNVDVFYSYRARKMENEQAAMLVCRFDR